MTEEAPPIDPIFTLDAPFQTAKDLSFHVRENVTRQQVAVVDGSFELEGADTEIVERVARRLAALSNWHADVVRMFRAGDAVTCLLSGETWLLAGSDPERGEVYPFGQPWAVAKAIDCVLVERASDAKHESWLARALEFEETDVRHMAAKRTIAKRTKVSEHPPA